MSKRILRQRSGIVRSAAFRSRDRASMRADRVPMRYRFDCLYYTGHLMSWQFIHDNHIVATERWCEALLNLREESGAVHRAIDHKWGNNPVVAQAGDKGDRFPMPVWDRCNQSLPRGQRPLSRTIFVPVAVSSINTRRSGTACLALVSNVGGRERHRRAFALPRARFFLKPHYVDQRDAGGRFDCRRCLTSPWQRGSL
jgi:hypothetical protein